MMQKVSSRVGFSEKSPGYSFPVDRSSSMWISFPPFETRCLLSLSNEPCTAQTKRVWSASRLGNCLKARTNLQLAVVDHESDVLSSSLLVVVLAVLSDVGGSFDENGFQSLAKVMRRSDLEDLGAAQEGLSSQKGEQRW